MRIKFLSHRNSSHKLFYQISKIADEFNDETGLTGLRLLVTIHAHRGFTSKSNFN